MLRVKFLYNHLHFDPKKVHVRGNSFGLNMTDPNKNSEIEKNKENIIKQCEKNLFKKNLFTFYMNDIVDTKSRSIRQKKCINGLVCIFIYSHSFTQLICLYMSFKAIFFVSFHSFSHRNCNQLLCLRNSYRILYHSRDHHSTTIPSLNLQRKINPFERKRFKIRTFAIQTHHNKLS